MELGGASLHKPLVSSPLVPPPPPRESLVAIALVTTAALLFGVVAAFVKAAALPTLVMLQCRSVIEWLVGVGVALVLHHRAAPATRTSLWLLLLGPPHLRGWLVLRSFFYWGFLCCWWYALSSVPIGDATTIVYCGPVFTAIFARVFLGERIDRSFYPVVALDAAGVVLITQPSFLFGRIAGAPAEESVAYMLGACGALAAAVCGGLLPVLTRHSKAASWTAVNHVSALVSAAVVTPLAFALWFRIDAGAWSAALESAAALATAAGVRPVLCLLGATGTGYVALALQTRGYQLAHAATKASLMNLLEIPFAYLVQYVVFGDAVGPLGLAGVALVAAGSACNMLYRRSERS